MKKLRHSLAQGSQLPSINGISARQSARIQVLLRITWHKWWINGGGRHACRLKHTWCIQKSKQRASLYYAFKQTREPASLVGKRDTWRVKIPLARLLLHQGPKPGFREDRPPKTLKASGPQTILIHFFLPKTKICGLGDKLLCQSELCYFCNLAWKYNIAENRGAIEKTPFYGLGFVCISVGGNGNFEEKN